MSNDNEKQVGNFGYQPERKGHQPDRDSTIIETPPSGGSAFAPPPPPKDTSQEKKK